MPTAQESYYGDGAVDYDDYDDTSRSSQHTDSEPWRNGANGLHVNGHAHGRGAYPADTDERTGYQISIDPRLKAKTQDAVGRHMLYETALMDCKTYEVLPIEEVDTLKKELARLLPRIEATQRKLVLENKVKDAAQNLRKLNSTRAHRVDTPQGPESPRKVRRSLLGQRQSTSGINDDNRQQIDEELANSQRTIDELNDMMKDLLDRRTQVEGRLLKHTAAILAQQHEEEISHFPSRHHPLDDDAVSEYAPDEFDGIRDILGGRTINNTSKRVGPGKMSEEHEQLLQSMQSRVERLNSQLRHVIEEAGRSRGVPTPAEISQPASNDPVTQVNNDLARLENSILELEREQVNTKAHYSQIQSSQHETMNAVEQQLESVNKSIHKTLLSSPAAQDLEISGPPPSSGHGYQHHITYLELLREKIEGVFHSHGGDGQKLDDYESTVAGLWDIIQHEPTATSEGGSGARSPALQKSFSLAAFSSRVQNIYDRAASAREQQDILRRQIQQQRELGSRSEETSQQLEELQGNHQNMIVAHERLQDELAKTMASHASSENEASQLRVELANVETEFEQLKKAATVKREEREEIVRQLQMHQAGHEQARAELEEVQEQLAQHTSKKQTKDKEMQDLEAEVVRLTTELTMAKAELDGAYGSRAERAREAQTGEVETLKERTSTLEQELAAMTSEFGELTRESLELERERSELDTTIDGLRERCEGLEAQLADEKVKWLGNKSPVSAPGQQAKEPTSMMVMRSEFKKMVREARAEGVKLLRQEQEQRRNVEAELRRLRQANTPLRKPVGSATG